MGISVVTQYQTIQVQHLWTHNTSRTTKGQEHNQADTQNQVETQY